MGETLRWQFVSNAWRAAMRMYAGLDTLDFDRVKIHVWLRRGRDANIRAGREELGDASTAILTELLKHLIEINVITPQATAEIFSKRRREHSKASATARGSSGQSKSLPTWAPDLGKQRIA